MSLASQTRSAIHDALHTLVKSGAFGDVERAAQVVREKTAWTVERPGRPEHGDLATNVAMVLAKPLGKPPRAIAELVVGALKENAVMRTVEVAGPGFINVRLHPRAFHAELREILATPRGYGHARSNTGERIHLEFVSANPTGPLLVSHGRGAIFGDAVGRLLEATGHRVTREYYINDFGNQVRIFAESVLAVAEGRPVPEEGYKGEYITELANWLTKVDPASLTGDRAAFSRTCVTWMLRGIPGSVTLPGIRRTLDELGVSFDCWFSEESLHRWGAVGVALRQLEDSGHLVRKDGALFFLAKEGEDDKDRVVQKSDGLYTYFASDIAYHADKLSRGYDRLINVLGADHHGYVARVRNSLEALGLPSERFEALLFQLVFVYRNGEIVKFSKRAGNIITVEEVTHEIDEAAGRKGAGRDALRFYFLSRSSNSNVEFDIELAKKASMDNPVFYVQYGYARLCSILAKAAELGITVPENLDDAGWAHLVHPDELAMTAKLSEFPAMVAEAAAGREPHRVAFYIQELARQFQSYFTRLKGEGDTILPQASERAVADWKAKWDEPKTLARLSWVKAIRTVYGAGLDLLGVSAPERMQRPVAAADSAESATDDEE